MSYMSLFLSTLLTGAPAPVASPSDAIAQPRRIWPARGADLPLQELPSPVMAALINVFKTETPGVEVDWLIEVDDHQRQPVTVVWSAVDQVTATLGEPLRTALPEIGSPEELTRRWNLALATEDGMSWTAEHLGLIDLALTGLSAPERSIIAAIPFVRGPTGSDQVLAQYEIRPREAARLVFGHINLDIPRSVFLGDPLSPKPMEVWVMFHEMGHAVARNTLNLAMRAFQQDLQEVLDIEAELKALDAAGARTARDQRLRERYRALADRHAALAEELEGGGALQRCADALNAAAEGSSPVEQAFATLLQGRKLPTQYSQTDARESFAEAFAFYHSDPAAMRRVMPDVGAWFDAGQHTTLGVVPLDLPACAP